MRAQTAGRCARRGSWRPQRKRCSRPWPSAAGLPRGPADGQLERAALEVIRLLARGREPEAKGARLPGPEPHRGMEASDAAAVERAAAREEDDPKYCRHLAPHRMEAGGGEE